MLQNIGDKLKGQNESGGRAHRWVYYLIIGALILVFAAWGPYSMVDMSFGGSGYAAKVNGEEIPLDRVNRTWQDQQVRLMELLGGNLTDAQRQLYQEEVINAEVQQLVTRQHARDLGFRVSDERVRDAFRAEEIFHVDGRFDLQTAQMRLATAGITEREYVEDLRSRQLNNLLLGVIGISNFFTEPESRRILSLLDEERELRYVLLQPEKFAGSAPVEPAAVEAWYQAHQENFAVPESVRLAYAELSMADIAAAVQIDEATLRARYEQDKLSYMQPETRRASHILIAVDGTTDDAAAAARAREIYDRIKAGGDFAALAREFSADTASAEKGGDLDWAGRDVYVKEFADKLFEMKQGEVSEPVKTQYGYHIIRLDGIRAPSGRTFEDVRAEIAASLRNELALRQFGERQDAIEQRLDGGGAGIDELVKDFGMRRGEIAEFERGAGGLPLGSDRDLNREVFSDASLTQRRVGGPLQLGEDRITVFQVLDHRPASIRPLDEVRDQVVAGVRRDRGTEAAYAEAQAAIGDGTGEKSFDQIASALKAKAEPASFVGRGSPDVPVEIRDAVFAAARPEAGKPLREVLKLKDGTVAVIQVSGSRVQSMSENPQLVEMRSDRELERYTRRDIQAYMAALREDAKVRVNPQAFQ